MLLSGAPIPNARDRIQKQSLYIRNACQPSFRASAIFCFCKNLAVSPPLEAISSKGGDCHVLYGKSAERALLPLACAAGRAAWRRSLKLTRRSLRSVAWRYAGRGAEFEDLVQEGCLALLVLIPRCPDRRWLARYPQNQPSGLCARRGGENEKTDNERRRDDDGRA